jgi:alkanesulfonate monooxygenase SsuD/methylene tetrahydromethanopterin reductase-like flavin-dependent oxidoreductase (luciferase family)
MKLGAALPHSGADASPDGMVAFAHRAEELGLDSLWVLERILRPVAPACWTRSTPSPILGANGRVQRQGSLRTPNRSFASHAATVAG